MSVRLKDSALYRHHKYTLNRFLFLFIYSNPLDYFCLHFLRERKEFAQSSPRPACSPTARNRDSNPLPITFLFTGFRTRPCTSFASPPSSHLQLKGKRSLNPLRLTFLLKGFRTRSLHWLFPAAVKGETEWWSTAGPVDTSWMGEWGWGWGGGVYKAVFPSISGLCLIYISSFNHRLLYFKNRCVNCVFTTFRCRK